MITAKDIREVQFNKSLGGYKITDVDEFLDKCAESFEALENQNEENTRKMQVLAKSIVGYREQEDSIRSAVMSAQRMSETIADESNRKANEIVSEAQKNADELLTNARAQAEEIISKAKSDSEDMLTKTEETMRSEKAELDELRNEVAKFKNNLLEMYHDHLKLIGFLPEDKDEPADEEVRATAEDPASDIEDDVIDEAEEPADDNAVETEPEQIQNVEEDETTLDDGPILTDFPEAIPFVADVQPIIGVDELEDTPI